MREDERQHDAKQCLSVLNNPVLEQRHKHEQALLWDL